MDKNTVLLVLDVQTGIVSPELHEAETFARSLSRLIAAARQSGVEVVFVRHNDGSGTRLEKGTPGFEIHPDFAPAEGERVFDKSVSSPFRSSGLKEYLRSKGIGRIILTGLFTEYCMDAAVKCGFEHGFEMVVPTEANSTAGNIHMTAAQAHRFYNEFMWPRRYARCVTADEAVLMLTNRD